MANEKRERQRENRQQQAVVAQAQERAVARRKQQRALIYGAGLLAVLLVGAFFLFGNDDDDGGGGTASGTTVAPTSPFPTAGGINPCAIVGTPENEQPPRINIDTTQTINATMVTNFGSMELELYPQNAPCTVNSFVNLARDGYYDGLTFHRVIEDFVIQGGDPTASGSGGPGYRFIDELPTGAYELGALAMANSGPNTNGSQFFVITGPNGQGLPQQYSKFGQVTEGLDVALAIQATPTGGADKPIDDAIIETITIK